MTNFRSVRFSTVRFDKEESPCPIRSQASENPPAKLPRAKSMLTSDAVLGYAKHGRAKWDEVKTVGHFFWKFSINNKAYVHKKLV